MDTTTSRRNFVKATAGGAAALAALASLRVPQAQAATTETKTEYFAGKANARQINDDLWWVGACDKRLALFENVYPLDHGVAYNSYLLLDEQTVLIDTVDRSVIGQYFENVEAVLDGRTLDYLIVDHMEPDHASGVAQVLTRYPECTLVTTALAQAMIGQFFEGVDISDRVITAAEGDTLTVGAHTLAFVEAPMVHWPEVMVTFDATTGILFSADAFGCFGALDGNMYADQVNFKEKWLDEARRYYCNIVGKYGPQVQDVLAKASTLDISMLCSTHGPIWREDLGWIIDKYDKWSSYTPEDEAVVVFYGSIYGGTENAANILASQLSQAGVNDVKVYDVSKTHGSYLIGEAFRASHLVFCRTARFPSLRTAPGARHPVSSCRTSWPPCPTWCRWATSSPSAPRPTPPTSRSSPSSPAPSQPPCRAMSPSAPPLRRPITLSPQPAPSRPPKRLPTW